jgi:hypothetical protein
MIKASGRAVDKQHSYRTPPDLQAGDVIIWDDGQKVKVADIRRQMILGQILVTFDDGTWMFFHPDDRLCVARPPHTRPL